MARLVAPTSLPRRVKLLAVFLLVVCFLIWRPFSLFDGDGMPSLFYTPSVRSVDVDVLQFVDPLIGTVNGGHVFPGATLPYGMAKAGPDTDSRGENAAGFVSDDSKITGFSHLHDSGTGGAASMGNFPLFVHPGCPSDTYLNCAYLPHDRSLHRVPNTTEASPGYFSIELNNTVRAEMTATEHTALYRFTFLPNRTLALPWPAEGDSETAEVPGNPLIFIDLQDIALTRSVGGVQVYESGRIIGEGTFRPSFGVGTYRAYFCADFRGAEIRTSGTFQGRFAVEEPKYLNQIERGLDNPSGSGGAWIHFEHPYSSDDDDADSDNKGDGHGRRRDGRILARVGLSFISADKACQNAEAEIPDFNFDGVVAAARSAWAEKLSVIEVDPQGVDEDLQTVFWSGLYRSLLSPQNYTGENPLWKSDEPYFDSFYCIWDSFRAQHPLLSIIDPEAQAQMVRAMLDIYRFEGKLPDCRMSFCKGYTQGGSNADVVIADAFLKNITEGIDWDTAYEAVLSDAEVPPHMFNVEGRGNIESWENLGFIAWDHRDKISSGPHSRTVSRTVEYAYDDYCIAVLAAGLGHEEDRERYMQRSTYWKNVWNPYQRDIVRDPDTGRWGKSPEQEETEPETTEFVGFPQPRYMNGTFRYQNTRRCSPITDTHLCYFDTAEATYEGSPWLYSFYAPQDMQGLALLMGGREGLVDRLEYYHESGIAYMGNEQSFLTVFQFHYGGRPGRSSHWVRRYIPSQFNATIAGIPGNDDCAMGAFSAMAMMGFFPVAGQDVYLLTVPFFREVKLRSRSEDGRLAIIRKVLSKEEAEERAGEDNVSVDDRDAMYVQSVKLNGEPYTKSWITHELFLNGGLLELVVGRRESAWGTQEEDLPPSYPFSGGG